MIIPKNPTEFKEFLTSRAGSKDDMQKKQEVNLAMKEYTENGVPEKLAKSFESELQKGIDFESRMSGVRPDDTTAFQVWQKYFPKG